MTSDKILTKNYENVEVSGLIYFAVMAAIIINHAVNDRWWNIIQNDEDTEYKHDEDNDGADNLPADNLQPEVVGDSFVSEIRMFLSEV